MCKLPTTIFFWCHCAVEFLCFPFSLVFFLFFLIRLSPYFYCSDPVLKLRNNKVITREVIRIYSRLKVYFKVVGFRTGPYVLPYIISKAI